jgi:hypothetical protein
VEERSASRLSFDLVHELFRCYLDRFGSFYLHSDSSAVGHLISALAREDAVHCEKWPESPRMNLQDPPAMVHDTVLEMAVLPEHMGCGHLRLILENPDDYRIRSGLLQDMIRAFFATRWSGDTRAVFDVLVGDHAESHVLNVRTRLKEGARTQVWQIPPSDGTRQIFVHHPDVVEHLLAAQSQFLVEQTLAETEEIQAMTDWQGQLYRTQVGLTILALAPDLPVFEANVEEDGLAIHDV